MKKPFLLFSLALSITLQGSALHAEQMPNESGRSGGSASMELPQAEETILTADLTRLAQAGVVAVFFEQEKDAKDFAMRLKASDSIVETVSTERFNISLSRVLSELPETHEVPVRRLRFALQDLSRAKVQGISFEKESVAAHFAALFGFPDPNSVVVKSQEGRFDMLNSNLLILQRL